MPKDKQKELLKAYFDKKEGIGYTVGRVNINSCDFSSDMYTYVKDGDVDLKSFNIEHDRKYKLPFIKESIAAAGGKLNLFASPWSPPSWMKSNNDMLHGGKLKTQKRLRAGQDDARFGQHLLDLVGDGRCDAHLIGCG